MTTTTMTTTDPSRPLSRYFCESFLLRAVCQNHVFVVAEILKRSDININIRSNHGQTALSLAAERGHIDIVTLLLRKPSIDVNARDADGQTALGWAVFNEHIEIVSTLLQNPDVRTDIADIDGMTPLSWAIAKGSAFILVLLFERLGIPPTKTIHRRRHKKHLFVVEGDVRAFVTSDFAEPLKLTIHEPCSTKNPPIFTSIVK
jgi:ankyrin repeat protein